MSRGSQRIAQNYGDLLAIFVFVDFSDNDKTNVNESSDPHESLLNVAEKMESGGRDDKIHLNFVDWDLARTTVSRCKFPYLAAMDVFDKPRVFFYPYMTAYMLIIDSIGFDVEKDDRQSKP